MNPPSFLLFYSALSGNVMRKNRYTRDIGEREKEIKRGREFLPRSLWRERENEFFKLDIVLLCSLWKCDEKKL